jgi:hypothetical protein
MSSYRTLATALLSGRRQKGAVYVRTILCPILRLICMQMVCHKEYQSEFVCHIIVIYCINVK